MKCKSRWHNTWFHRLKADSDEWAAWTSERAPLAKALCAPLQGSPLHPPTINFPYKSDNSDTVHSFLLILIYFNLGHVLRMLSKLLLGKLRFQSTQNRSQHHIFGLNLLKNNPCSSISIRIASLSYNNNNNNNNNNDDDDDENSHNMMPIIINLNNKNNNKWWD